MILLEMLWLEQQYSSGKLPSSALRLWDLAHGNLARTCLIQDIHVKLHLLNKIYIALHCIPSFLHCLTCTFTFAFASYITFTIHSLILFGVHACYNYEHVWKVGLRTHMRFTSMSYTNIEWASPSFRHKMSGRDLLRSHGQIRAGTRSGLHSESSESNYVAS